LAWEGDRPREGTEHALGIVIARVTFFAFHFLLATQYQPVVRGLNLEVLRIQSGHLRQDHYFVVRFFEPDCWIAVTKEGWKTPTIIFRIRAFAFKSLQPPIQHLVYVFAELSQSATPLRALSVLMSVHSRPPQPAVKCDWYIFPQARQSMFQIVRQQFSHVASPMIVARAAHLRLVRASVSADFDFDLPGLGFLSHREM
jgi:hypothetical protein